ncbi:MAG: hypothetical protein BWY95_02385 [Bacteroidetes bacterium ADurb.BinA104]|nr:MAG: hypothetical protein BWY95_02385 [Bacteroidetes bacterium ADurb.BinA104]
MMAISTILTNTIIVPTRWTATAGSAKTCSLLMQEQQTQGLQHHLFMILNHMTGKQFHYQVAQLVGMQELHIILRHGVSRRQMQHSTITHQILHIQFLYQTRVFTIHQLVIHHKTSRLSSTTIIKILPNHQQQFLDGRRQMLMEKQTSVHRVFHQQLQRTRS